MEEQIWGQNLFCYKVEKEQVTITKWLAEEREVVIPEAVEGYPVTALGDYALARGPYEQIFLPDSLVKIGRYAFYNCFSLQRLGFYTSIQDVGAGAFTGCHQVRTLEVTEVKGKRSCFRDVLSEFSEELAVEYHGEQEARLMFPEFYEEGVENTPARILMTQVHGSGIHYRNCFVNGELNFMEYDSRFSMAKAQESESFLVRLVLGRLLYPYRLETRRKQEYEEYLAAHLTAAGEYLIRHGDVEALQRLGDAYVQGEEGKKALEQFLLAAQKLHRGEMVSYLMELRHHRYPAKRPVFEL